MIFFVIAFLWIVEATQLLFFFVIRWCPGHPCFLHQVFFHWHSPSWFCTRFLNQVFFLWHSSAWFCTRFKLWKWNCSAIWHNLSSFHSNLHKIVVRSYCLCTKSERLYLARENTVSWDIHTEKISRSVLFFVIAFLWIVEAAQLLFILYHCVLAIFLILKNCQVSVIFLSLLFSE